MMLSDTDNNDRSLSAVKKTFLIDMTESCPISEAVAVLCLSGLKLQELFFIL